MKAVLAPCLTAISMTALGSGLGPAATLRVGLQDYPDALDRRSRHLIPAALFRGVVDSFSDNLARAQDPYRSLEAVSGPRRQVLTFTLRQDVTFHDGTAFDAAAVKSNIERMKTNADSKRKASLRRSRASRLLPADKWRFNRSEPFCAARQSQRPCRHDGVAQGSRPRKVGEFAAARVLRRSYHFVERKSRDLIRVKKYPALGMPAKIRLLPMSSITMVPDSTVRLSSGARRRSRHRRTHRADRP